MDHAQEVALWKAIGELESEVDDLQRTFDLLQKETITRPRAMFRVAIAFCAGMIAMGFLMDDRLGKRRAVIIQAAYELVP